MERNDIYFFKVVLYIVFLIQQIACLSVGDLRGEGKNSLIVLSGEGFCYLFDISVCQNTDILIHFLIFQADEDEPVIETKSPIPKHNSDTNLKPSLKTTPSTYVS